MTKKHRSSFQNPGRGDATKRLPYVRVAAICDHAVIDSDDGMMSLVRLVDRLDTQVVVVRAKEQAQSDIETIAAGASHVWAVHQLTYVLSVLSPDLKGSFGVGISLISPDGSRKPLAQPFNVEIRAEDTGVNVRFRFSLPPNGPEGLYWFISSWDGVELVRTPFWLRRLPTTTAKRHDEPPLPQGPTSHEAPDPEVGA